MKIGFAAHDVGPSNMFAGPVADAARAVGHKVVQLAAGKPWDVAGFHSIVNCDVVALGFASFESGPESALAGALWQAGVPTAFVEDVPGALLSRIVARGPFLADTASGYVAALPSGVEAATRAGFENVVCITPPHWGPSYEALTQKGDARNGLVTKRVGSDESVRLFDLPLVVVWGTKSLPLELEVTRQVIASARELWGGDGFAIACYVHPQLLAEAKVAHFLELRGYADVLGHTRYLVTNGVSVETCLRAATVAVCGGAPLELITGAYARLPLVMYEGAFPGGNVLDRNRSQGISSGHYFVGELGGALVATGGASTLSWAFHQLTASAALESRKTLLAKQEAAFPLPETWDTAPALVKYLAGLAS
jgi:hypothetical protein